MLHIQYSHFFGSETFLAFFVTAVMYCSVRIVKYEGKWTYAFAGVALGLALACKLNAAPLVLHPGHRGVGEDVASPGGAGGPGSAPCL